LVLSGVAEMLNVIDFTVLRDEKAFYLLKEEWNSLLDRSESKSVFLTWEWLYNWWKVYREDRELFIICGYDGEELKAIFPLLKRKLKRLGIFKEVRLEFLGTGEDERDEVCSYLMEPIIYLDEKCDLYYDALLSFLSGHLLNEWDYIYLSSLRASSAFVKAITNFFKSADYVIRINKTFDNGVTILDVGWDGFIKSLGKRTRKRLKREKKILEATNGFNYKFLEDEKDLHKMLDIFKDLSLKRWGKKSAFASSKFFDFQKMVCKDFYKKGILKLSLMEGNGKIIAGNLDYAYKDTVYGYQTAFDPVFNSKIGVGFLSMVYCIESAINEGYKRYDWYRTRENSYKAHFITLSEEILNISVSKT